MSNFPTAAIDSTYFRLNFLCFDFKNIFFFISDLGTSYSQIKNYLRQKSNQITEDKGQQNCIYLWLKH